MTILVGIIIFQQWMESNKSYFRQTRLKPPKSICRKRPLLFVSALRLLRRDVNRHWGYLGGAICETMCPSPDYHLRQFTACPVDKPGNDIMELTLIFDSSHHWSIHQLGTSVVFCVFLPPWIFPLKPPFIARSQCVPKGYSCWWKTHPGAEKKPRFTEMRIKTYQNSRFTAPGGILPSHIRG